MIVATTYEQYKNLPKNKGKDSKVIYKEWLFEENKLIIMYDSIVMMFGLQVNSFNNNVYGPYGAGAGASGGEGGEIPPIPPSTKVTYYTPNGSDGITLGYYTPDLDDTINSYYIYV
jgi:hypothetical protein